MSDHVGMAMAGASRFGRVRLLIWRKRWLARLILWVAYAALGFALPYSPDEGPGYLIGLVVLALITGALIPRPLLAAGVGIYFATLMRMATLPESLYPYVSIEIATVPLFAGLARGIVWLAVDRKFRAVVAEPPKRGEPQPV